MNDKKQFGRSALPQLLIGIGLVFLPGMFLWLAFMFSSMVPPELTGMDWWYSVIGKMYALPAPGIGTIPATALLLMGIGIVSHAIYRLVKTDRGERKMGRNETGG